MESWHCFTESRDRWVGFEFTYTNWWGNQMFDRPLLWFPFVPLLLFTVVLFVAGDFRSECAKWQSTREQLCPYLHGLIGVLLAGASFVSGLAPFEFRFICLRRKFISFSFVKPQLMDKIWGNSVTRAYWLVGVNFLQVSQNAGVVFSTLSEFRSTWLKLT